MLKRSVKRFPNVGVQTFENQFLVNYANSVGANYILRGIRSEGDYEYERGMRHVNSDLNPKIATIFLMPPREIAEVSSSLVRGLVGPEGWEEVVKKYLPRNVYNQFLIKFRGLEKRWNNLWKEMGATGPNKKVYEELVSLYGESHRAYHNFVHLADSLSELDEVAEFVPDSRQVEFGLWYHDAIYNTKSKKNEERSAELAGERLTQAGIAKQFIESITAMILATKHDEKPRSVNSQYLADIDLSILGKSSDEFEEYERDIKFEYEEIPEIQFKEGRKRILQGFLDRGSIYYTDFFRQKYEAQARKNLEKAISS